MDVRASERGGGVPGATKPLLQPLRIPSVPLYNVPKVNGGDATQSVLGKGMTIPQGGHQGGGRRKGIPFHIPPVPSSTRNSSSAKESPISTNKLSTVSSSSHIPTTTSYSITWRTTSTTKTTPSRSSATTTSTSAALLPASTSSTGFGRSNGVPNRAKMKGCVGAVGTMIGGACQGATPTSLPQPIGAALRPPWPSATIEGFGPYAGLYSLLTVSATATPVTTTTTTATIPRSPGAPPPMSPPGAPITTPMAGVVATHAVLAQLHALCVQQKDGALAGALPPPMLPGQLGATPAVLESIPRPTVPASSYGPPKSTFSTINTVATTGSITESNRDNGRPLSLSYSVKTPVVASRTTPKLNHKKVTPPIASKVNGHAIAAEQSSAVTLKSSFNSAKEEKDKTGVLNTRVVEQPLNCKITARTVSSQPSCPMSGISGTVSTTVIAKTVLSPVTSVSRVSETSIASSVPAAEKDKERIVQNHTASILQVPDNSILAKLSVPNAHELSAPRPDTVRCNGKSSTEEANATVTFPTRSSGMKCSSSCVTTKPKTGHNSIIISSIPQPPSDLHFQPENIETFSRNAQAFLLETTNDNMKSALNNNNDLENKDCSDDANNISSEVQQEDSEKLKKQGSGSEEGNENPLASLIGDQCSRTTPGLHETFVQGRKSKSHDQVTPIVTTMVSPVPSLSPVNTPISVGDASSSTSCPPIMALTQLTVPRVAPPATAAAATGGAGTGDVCNRARKPTSRSEERPTPAVTCGNSIPVGIAVARQRQEPRPPDDPPGPLSNGVGASPGGNTLSSHWPLPPGIPSTPYWLSQSQFSGVGMDASVGAGMGLGYQFVRDPLGHYYVLPHPHAIPDPGGHSLVWAGYGGVAAAPPVVMTPQQLLLPEAHYHRALHAHTALVHVPHAHAPVHSPTATSIKREDPPTPGTPEEDPKNRSLNAPLSAQGPIPPGTELNLSSPLSTSLRHLAPPFLYPSPSTLPYYCPQSPHGPPYSIPPFSHPPTSAIGSSSLTTSLTNSLTTTLTNTLTGQGNITTTYSVLPAAPVTSVAKGSGLEHCASKGYESLVATASPVPRSDSSEPINITSHSEEEPDAELPLPKAQSVATPLSLPLPFRIKQEIKEEIPSPVETGREELCTLGIGEPPENHLGPAHVIAVKKENLSGCEASVPTCHEQTQQAAVYITQVTQPCSKSIPASCPMLLSGDFSDSNLPGNQTSVTSSTPSVTCQESDAEHPLETALSESPKDFCEPPVALHTDSVNFRYTEPQRALSPQPCDKITRETHSSTNLEMSPVTTNSKSLILNFSTPVCVSSESKPLTVVHPVPQTSLCEEESSSVTSSHCLRSPEGDSSNETDSQVAQQSPYLDLSGLELLSQSVLQHANRLADMPSEQSSVECAPPVYKQTSSYDCNSQDTLPVEECAILTERERFTSDFQHNSLEKSLQRSCITEKKTLENHSPLEHRENHLENYNMEENAMDSEVCTNKRKTLSDNSCSDIGSERKKGRDRMPELVQAVLSELPCSPSAPESPAPCSDSVGDLPVQYSIPSAATSLPDRISGLHGLSLLCALAEQRIMEEEHVACPALSSLADIAATSPSVPTHPLQCSPSPPPASPRLVSPQPASPQPASPQPDSPQLASPRPASPQPSSPQPGPSCLPRSLYTGPFGSGTSSAIFGAVTFGTIANSYNTPLKVADVNRNYKSPESEREAKAYIANKASQYQKETIENFKSPSGFPVDSMDATELDMRMQLAELQRKYRETQRELSRLPAKKIVSTPIKRGPGRPPKRKIINNDIPGKKKVGRPPSKRKSPQKELSPPVLERVTDLDIKDISKDSDEDKEESRSTSRSILKPPVLTATFTNHRILTENHMSVPKTLETQISSEKEESSDDDTDKDKTRRWSFSSEDTAPPSLGSPFKPPVATPETRQEESEEEQLKEVPPDNTVQDLKVLNIETSVESSPSDLEQQSASSSASKKRKPGRPKKHSPTKEDATETIVAKKPKTLNFLLHRPLLSHKPKIKPKLKAEVKVREEEEEDNSPRPHYTLSSQSESSVQVLSEEEEDHKPTVRLSTADIVHGARKRGCPRGRASFTRRTMLRDKEKRKSAAEKQSHMEALYRSLKKHSKMAAAEHDESEEERDREDKDIDIQECIAVRGLGTSGGGADSSSSDHEASHKSSEGDLISTSTASVSSFTTTITTTATTVTTTSTITTTTASCDAPRPAIKTPEPSVCVMEMSDLVDKARVLVLLDGLLYAGHVVSITPPDVYGVVIDGERGSRPHIYSREELLQQSWKEVKPGTSRFLVEGTRVCAFWSQQYRALYPGCIAASSSPAHEANHNFVNVEFDDGDSGKIHVDDIRLLPPDFPVIEYDPNPLMTLNKRKRRPTGDSHVSDIKEETQKVKQKKVRTYSGTSIDSEGRLNDQDDENHEVEKENKSSTVNIENKEKENKGMLQNKRNDKKKHKKHKHTESSHHHHHKHRNKHKHKHREGDRPLPHVEPGANELKMRIKSPPPPLSESQRQSFLEDSDSEEENSSKSPSDEESGDDSEYTPSKKEVTKGPARKKKRHPSGKSKIAPFLPERQLWRWSGKGFKRPGAKGKGKKEFFKAIVRGKEMIRVEDCAVFLSAGQPDRPYIGRIEHMWESWGGNMVVKVKWFYHPQETKGLGKRLTEPKGALFQSPHTDENDVQTISHKCDVISLSDYRIRRGELESRYGPNYENTDVYYLAGSYDPISGHITMEPGVS